MPYGIDGNFLLGLLRLVQTVAGKIACTILVYNILYINFVENYFVIRMIAALNCSSILC